MTKNLYCDNYATCHGMVMWRGTRDMTESVARARGWSIFHGTLQSGEEHHGVLCEQCLGRGKLGPRAPKVLEGQMELPL